MMNSSIQFIFVILFALFMGCCCWKHKLKVSEDYRPFIKLITFGLYQRGYLDVKFEDFRYGPIGEGNMFSFALEKMIGDQTSVDVPNKQCSMKKIFSEMNMKYNVTFLILDLKNNQLTGSCNRSLSSLYFYNDSLQIPRIFTGENELDEIGVPKVKGKSCSNLSLPIEIKNSSYGITYNTRFTMYVPSENEEGLYVLYFLNCASNDYAVNASFNVQIEARNRLSELSAGYIPLPYVYFFMSTVFHLTFGVWIYILMKSRHIVFKIHYLMAVMVLLKSVSLLLQGINYYFIGKRGEYIYPWTTLYHIAYVLRGFLFFVTIILIGTGWNFIKHILSKKDKRLFTIVLPLQVFANIAKFISEESEVSDPAYVWWSTLFTFIDFVCCCAIIFPILWSISHLNLASRVDGKAAINLNKLKLFRYFYAITIGYIYATRMVAHLLRMTVPFQYLWLVPLFTEIATLIFFIMTGYTFRPTSSNPYFETSRAGDNEMDICVTQCGLTEGLTKLSRISNETGDDDQDTLLVYKRDSVN